MSVILTAITLIECDGIEEFRCSTVLELPHTQGVAIRLARQSGWTIWLETHCPECSSVPAAPETPAPEVPASLGWPVVDPRQEATGGKVLLDA